jgi:hypothetical protein
MLQGAGAISFSRAGGVSHGRIAATVRLPRPPERPQ